jgi:hypothetical protein
MKRKFLVLLSVVLILALACTACGNKNNNNEDCEHTYGEKWSSNATEHWHAATCEHAELKSDVAAHTDADQDGKCDVCGYEIGHEHTYADVWTSNVTHHWKIATCSHTDEKGYFALHSDANFDNVCDVCSVAIEFVIPTDVASAVELVASRAAAVNGGVFNYGYIGRNHNDVNVEATKNITYVFGSDSLHLVVESWDKQPNDLTPNDNTDFVEATDVMKGWYQLISEDSVFSVTETTFEGVTSDYELNAGADPSIMNGYYCALSTLTDAYGPENLLVALYTLSQSDAASDFVVTYDEQTFTYSFSFGYLYVNTEMPEGEAPHVDYYEVAVSFTYSGNGALTYLNVVTDCYTNSLEDEEDNDYTYDQAEHTITMKETALADTYTLVFTQTTGDRTYVNENPQSKFVPTDYGFFSDEEGTTSINGTITVTKDQAASVYFGGFFPTDSSILYVADSVTFTADESLNVWFYGNHIGLNAKTVGTYTVEFTVAGVTKSFTVVVVEASGSGDGNVVVGDNQFSVKTTETYDAYMTDLYTFTATGSGEYTFTLPAGLGLWSVESLSQNRFGNPEVDYYDNEEGATVVVELAEGEEYSFYVAAVTKGDWVISYTYVYREVENDQNGDNANLKDSNGLGGEYRINWIMEGMFVLTFTPDAAGSRLGTLVIVDNNNSKNGGTFTYTIENGAYILFDSTNMITTTVAIYNDGTDWYFKNASCPNGTKLTSMAAAGDVATSVIAGTYTSTSDSATLTVIVDADTITFEYSHPMTGSSSETYDYEVVNGKVVIYDDGGYELNPLSGKLEIDAEGLPVSADYSGYTYNF